jgi:phosphomannomutase
MLLSQYDLIAFDLDGTLTESKAPLKPEMAALLVELLGKIKVAVISGASLSQFERQFLGHLPASPSEFKNLHILPTNGITRCEFDAGWKCEHDYEFTEEEKETIYAAFDKALKEAGFVPPEKMYGDMLEDRGMQITFSALGMNAPYEIKKLWDPDHHKRENIKSFLAPLLPNFSIHIDGTTSIDVNRFGLDKAYGLKQLLKRLSITPVNMLFVGDELFPNGGDASVLSLECKTLSVHDPAETEGIVRNLLTKG